MRVASKHLAILVAIAFVFVAARNASPGTKAKSMPEDATLQFLDHERALRLVKKLALFRHYSSALVVIETELERGYFHIALLERKASILRLKGEFNRSLDQYVALLQSRNASWTPSTGQIDEIGSIARSLNRSFEVDRAALVLLGQRSGTIAFYAMADEAKRPGRNASQKDCQNFMMRSSLAMLTGDTPRGREWLERARALAPRNRAVQRRLSHLSGL